MTGGEDHIQATGKGFAALAFVPENSGHRQVHAAQVLDAGAVPVQTASGFQVAQLHEQGAGLIRVAVVAVVEAAKVEQICLAQQRKCASSRRSTSGQPQ
ncbi:MAG: hypothetical protein GAK32_00152 [Pseudomonas fluorescens]|nr:MAG: hypothetical protein GAK32_00152 [Pseudomonas fluorescens]